MVLADKWRDIHEKNGCNRFRADLQQDRRSRRHRRAEMNGCDLRQDVIAWLEENHNLRPEHQWRFDVAKRLVHDDMLPAWDELATHGATDGRHILSFVIDAAEHAHSECLRFATSEESERIAEVRKALDTLREAIDRAPFLDAAHFIDLDGKPVMFSWRRTGAKVAAELHAPTQVICLDDLLEFARDAIPDIAAWQPGRTVDRQRGNPQLAAFVRHLAARFQDRYGAQMEGAIARIASVAYGDPVTQEKVEGVLRIPPQ